MISEPPVVAPVVNTSPKPRPQEKKPEAAAEKPAAPASLRPTEEEFYHDPLVELALKEFHATIIK